jgi:predicted nucleotidyltransferase
MSSDIIITLHIQSRRFGRANMLGYGSLARGAIMPDSLFPDRDSLAAVCRRYGIRRMSLFGSVLKGTASPASDVDLLVEFEPGGKPGLLGLAAIEEALSALLGGRRVDLRTAPDLSPYFRDEIVRTAALQYAA